MAILKDNRAFGLIEALISIAVFSLIAVTGTASIVSVIDSNQVSQNSNSVVTNLNIALEEMAREIRTGSDYKVSEDGTEITFKPDRGCDDACITYRFNRALQTVEKQNSELAEVSFVPIIANEVKVEEMNFSLIKREVEDNILNPDSVTYIGIDGVKNTKDFDDIYFANKIISFNPGNYPPTCNSHYQNPESALGRPLYPGSNSMTNAMCDSPGWDTYPDPLNPTNQLPKSNDSTYSMGWKGELVLSFPKYLTNSGDSKEDIWIVETGNRVDTVDVYGRLVGETDFIYLGHTSSARLGGVDIDEELNKMGSGIAGPGTKIFDQVKIVDRAKELCTPGLINRSLCTTEDEYYNTGNPDDDCVAFGNSPNNCQSHKRYAGADIDAVGIIHTKPRPDQPGVLLKIKGYSQTREANRSDFFLQTLISQRVTE